MNHRVVLALILLASLIVSGCTTQSFSNAEKFRRYSTDTRVLLLPVDITLGEITADHDAVWCHAISQAQHGLAGYGNVGRAKMQIGNVQ